MYISKKRRLKLDHELEEIQQIRNNFGGHTDRMRLDAQLREYYSNDEKGLASFVKECDDYLKWCDKVGKKYTMSGLLLFLNYTIDQFKNLEKRKLFHSACKRIRLIVEEQAVQELLSRKQSGINLIFYLKNAFAWKDVASVEQNTQQTNTLQLCVEDRIRDIASTIKQVEQQSSTKTIEVEREDQDYVDALNYPNATTSSVIASIARVQKIK